MQVRQPFRPRSGKAPAHQLCAQIEPADPRSLRKAYLAEFDRYIREVRQGCRAHRIDYVPLRTDQPLDVALSAYLASRL